MNQIHRNGLQSPRFLLDVQNMIKIFKKIAPDLPVIMLTGHGSEEAARDGIRFGAFDYLTKPCDFEELIVKIKDAYQQRI